MNFYQKYRIVRKNAEIESDEVESPKGFVQGHVSKIQQITATILLSLIFIITLVSYPFTQLPSQSSQLRLIPSQPNSCKNPVLRREWRSLSILERADYLSAVVCLNSHPSRLGLNHTLYDDFPWVHSGAGNFSHNTPEFVAWHRYYLHIYETTLREQCGYKGHLAYWDWSLDWEDMTKSPLWDSEVGFGKDGDPNGEVIFTRARCVTDGPFKNQTLLYFGDETKPHCLSRAFQRGSRSFKNFGKIVNPDALNRILEQPTYEDFNQELEDGPHDAIPMSIRGDFSKTTAPNDPVFFLHHTQLDRMWWEWQRRQKLRGTGIEGPGNLDYLYPYGGLAPDKKVREIMSTESDLLCYTY